MLNSLSGRNLHLNLGLDFSHDSFQTLDVLRLSLPGWRSCIFGQFCMSATPLSVQFTNVELFVLLRKLFRLSRRLKYWRRSPSISRCSAAPFIEAGESPRVTPEALCSGVCWEEANEALGETGTASAGEMAFVPWHRPKCTQSHFPRKEERTPASRFSGGGNGLQVPVPPQIQFFKGLACQRGAVSRRGRREEGWRHAGGWVWFWQVATWQKLCQRVKQVCAAAGSAVAELLRAGQGGIRVSPGLQLAAVVLDTWLLETSQREGDPLLPLHVFGSELFSVLIFDLNFWKG